MVLLLLNITVIISYYYIGYNVIITYITVPLLPIITVIMGSLLPIITRSTISNNGFIFTYYGPGKLGMYPII